MGATVIGAWAPSVLGASSARCSAVVSSAACVSVTSSRSRAATVIHVMLVRQFFKFRLVAWTGHFGRGGQTISRAIRDSLAVTIEQANEVSDVAKRQVGSTRGNESRIVPQRKIVRIAVPGIGGCQVEGHFVVGCRWNFETNFTTGSQRSDWHLPGRGTVTFPNVTDAGEQPKSLLPLEGRSQ